MKLKELFTNEKGEMSTTSTIQMMSAITLCIGFFVAFAVDRSIVVEIGFLLTGMATLTATSKGVFGKREKEHGKD